MYCAVLIILYLNLNLINSNEYGSTEESRIWTGLWFPNPPKFTSDNKNEDISMKIEDTSCDNAEDNIAIDFDPNNMIDQLMYVCSDIRRKYSPSKNIQPILKEYLIPKAYRPLHICNNESINYTYRLPTFGNHHLLWARYGEYKYLPIQRWLHNLEHGAIVFLYHPCANENQVDKVRNIIENCLYRYIITSSKMLLPNRPLALVSWGRSLEFSVANEDIIVNFIKLYALKGREEIIKNGKYDKLLIKNARIVSDKNDTVLCPNFNLNRKNSHMK